VDAIREAVLVLYEAVRDGEDPGEIITKLSGRPEQPRSSAPITNSANHLPATSEPRDQSPTLSTTTDWPEHVELYRRHKLHSGEVKQATWDRMYRPRMVLLLKLLDPTSVAAPQDSTALVQRVAEQWASQPGCRARQIQVQYTAAMLRWLVHLGHLSDQWSPPQDLSPYVGRSRQQKTITTPIAVEHILALLEAMPDSRWRLCFQLISAFGLRPEEIQHLELREGRLWCLYEKVAARGKTKPRPLRLLPSYDWAAEWNLERTFKQSLLPPMRSGHGAHDITQYLRRRPLWRDLRREYEQKGEKLVLYSCRHAYAHRAHVICDLPPKVVAAAMGHSVQTHLAAYSRWCGDDVVDDAFAKAEQRLGQGLRAQSSAA